MQTQTLPEDYPSAVERILSSLISPNGKPSEALRALLNLHSLTIKVGTTLDKTLRDLVATTQEAWQHWIALPGGGRRPAKRAEFPYTERNNSLEPTREKTRDCLRALGLFGRILPAQQAYDTAIFHAHWVHNMRLVFRSLAELLANGQLSIKKLVIVGADSPVSPEELLSLEPQPPVWRSASETVCGHSLFLGIVRPNCRDITVELVNAKSRPSTDGKMLVPTTDQALGEWLSKKQGSSLGKVMVMGCQPYILRQAMLTYKLLQSICSKASESGSRWSMSSIDVMNNAQEPPNDNPAEDLREVSAFLWAWRQSRMSAQ